MTHAIELASSQGRFYDGKSAAAISLKVTLETGGVRFPESEGFWQNGSFRAELDPGENFLRLYPADEPNVRLLVEDADFVAAFRARHAGARRYPPLLVAAAALIATGLALSAAYWGFLRATERIAASIPPQAERRFGNFAWEALAPASGRSTSPSALKVAETVVARLGPHVDSPHAFALAVTNDVEPNAWAVPGGFMAVHQGLLCAMENGDQLAAVIAHEMSHVVYRHPTRNLIRTLSFQVGLSLLFGGGDPTADTALVLGALHFSRVDEEAADAGALRILANAQVAPAALAQAFARLQIASAGAPSRFRYLSSHPPIESRRQAAEKAARELRVAATRVIDNVEWQRMRTECRCGGTQE